MAPKASPSTSLFAAAKQAKDKAKRTAELRAQDAKRAAEAMKAKAQSSAHKLASMKGAEPIRMEGGAKPNPGMTVGACGAKRKPAPKRAYVPQTAAETEREKSAECEAIARLCSLGFSVAAVRHALATCRGRVEDAGLWLIDSNHADEIYVAERVMAAASKLRAGGSARISGLRGARHLNGAVVVLEQYDSSTQRWIVRMADASHKSIRPRNLDSLDKAIAVVEDKDEKDIDPAAAAPSISKRDAEELRAQVCELAGAADSDVQQAIKDLSVPKLLEVIEGLASDTDAGGKIGAGEVGDGSAGATVSVQASAGEQLADDGWRPNAADDCVGPTSARPDADASCQRVFQPPPRQHTADDADRLSGARPEVEALSCSSPSAGADGEIAALRLQLREQAAHMANLEAESRCRAEALEAALSESESRCRAEEAQADAELLRLAEARIEMSPGESLSSAAVAGLNQDELHEERREVESLRAAAAASAAAARELEEQQEVQREAQQRLAQDHELQLLEEEAELHRLRNALQGEQERVDHERRSVLMLQQSLLESIDSTKGGEGTLEVALDEQGVAEEMSSGDESDVAEEVWDLDWSALGGQNPCGEAPSLPGPSPGFSQDAAVETDEQKAAA